MAQLPTQSQFGDYSEWPGRDVLDSGGQRLGGVREIYLDRETGRPEWVLVDVDDGDARFVPLADAAVEARSIKVAHTAEKIKSAPGIGAEPRIDQSEERRLYAHYGLGYVEGDSGNDVRADDPPAPTGWGQKEEPSWQARGGETTEQETVADPTPPTDTWSTAAEPTNDAPPPAEPPAPSEIEAAEIPEEPPAASDLGSAYETAPFGAVAPKDEPRADEPPADAVDAPPLFAEPADEPTGVTDTTVGATDDRSPLPPDDEADETPSALTPHPAPPEGEADETPSALTPHAAPPEDVLPDPVDPTDVPDVPSVADPADLADPGAPPLDEPPLGTLDSPPADVPAALDTSPVEAVDSSPEVAAFSTSTDPAGALPPVTVDTPEAADSPPAAPEPASIPRPPLGATPPISEEQGAPGGALERVKRDPKKVALAAVGAAMLFFIIRRLR